MHTLIVEHPGTRPEIQSEHFDPSFLYFLDLKEDRGTGALILAIDVEDRAAHVRLGRFEFDQVIRPFDLQVLVHVQHCFAPPKPNTDVLLALARLIAENAEYDLNDGSLYLELNAPEFAIWRYVSELTLTPTKPGAKLQHFPLAPKPGGTDPDLDIFELLETD